MKAIHLNERSLRIIKGAVGKLGMRAALARDVTIDGEPVTTEDLRDLVLSITGAEEVKDEGVDPDFLSEAERFVIASGIGALVVAGARAPESVELSITEKLNLVMTKDQKRQAVMQLAAQMLAEQK